METWYVLEDGSVADPANVAPDAQGVLRHSNGVAVALGPHGPRSRSVDVDAERAKAESAGKPKDMTPEAVRRGYKTRDAKAD